MPNKKTGIPLDSSLPAAMWASVGWKKRSTVVQFGSCDSCCVKPRGWLGEKPYDSERLQWVKSSNVPADLGLLDGHRLGEISRLIDVGASEYCNVVGQ